RPTITAEQLLTIPDSDQFELIDGKLVEINMGARASYIEARLTRLLVAFCESPFAGWVLPGDTSYQCFPNRPNVVRRPDVSVIRPGRLPSETLPEGHLRLAPDLVAEVVSPNDLYYEVEEKIAEYRSAGVRLIWLLVPPSRT